VADLLLATDGDLAAVGVKVGHRRRILAASATSLHGEGAGGRAIAAEGEATSAITTQAPARPLPYVSSHARLSLWLRS
jgi:hypothetical protein